MAAAANSYITVYKYYNLLHRDFNIFLRIFDRTYIVYFCNINIKLIKIFFAEKIFAIER
jgi:hypothetical protein